jgi:hypothetical protein
MGSKIRGRWTACVIGSRGRSEALARSLRRRRSESGGGWLEVCVRASVRALTRGKSRATRAGGRAESQEEEEEGREEAEWEDDTGLMMRSPAWLSRVGRTKAVTTSQLRPRPGVISAPFRPTLPLSLLAWSCHGLLHPEDLLLANSSRATHNHSALPPGDALER